jgi:hypothetical protein
VDSLALRKATVETLGLLVERYPNLRIGQIVGHALGDAHDLAYLPDIELARQLNQLFVAYTQFEAAKIMKYEEI